MYDECEKRGISRVKEIQDLIKKAEKFLFTAEQALKIEDYDSCVS